MQLFEQAVERDSLSQEDFALPHIPPFSSSAHFNNNSNNNNALSYIKEG